jgi:hypothetical protein
MASRMLSLDHVACSYISKEHTRYTALFRQHYLKKYFVFAFVISVTSYLRLETVSVSLLNADIYIYYDWYCQVTVSVARTATFVRATNLHRTSTRKYSNYWTQGTRSYTTAIEEYWFLHLLWNRRTTLLPSTRHSCHLSTDL